MKQFLTFVKKEFLHVLRDRKTLLVLFGLPIVQILIFGFALTNEVKNARIMVLDQAHDGASQKLIAEVDASRYFEVDRAIRSASEIEKTFKEGGVKIALVIPEGFQDALLHENQGNIQVIADATDPNTATALTNYLSGIIMDFQDRVNGGAQMPYRIIPEMRMLYNPQLKGVHNFVPGVMALVLMLVCVMMTAISIVREKESGTMEVLLVSPFKPILVILSKALPYLLLSLVNVSTIILLSIFVLDLPVNGSILLLFAESTLFIITCLAIGLLISVKAKTQQTAMLISMMGMMLPTILFSGFMFPIENMPKPLQYISNIVPSKWFYIIVKSIMIKGLGFQSIWKESCILFGIALLMTVISLKNFKIRLA